MNRNAGKGVYLFLAAVLLLGLVLVAGPTPAMADFAVPTGAKVTIHEQPDGGVGGEGGVSIAAYATFDNPNYYYANITNAPDGTKYRQAGLSPDGKKLVAVKQVGTTAGTGWWEIVLMNADGSGETRISPGDSGTGDIYEYTNPFWSDDGSVVGFAEVHKTNPNKIVRYDISASTRTYIYEPVAPLDASNPDFVGNSTTTIVFWDRRAVGEGADLFTWDGTTRTNLTNTADYYEYEPVSNADGTKIVYWSGETTAEPVDTTHTLTYSGGTWTKDVGFTPITGTYWSYWTTSAATHIATTLLTDYSGTVDVYLYDNTGTFVADLSGPGYSGGVGQWNFFGSMPQGPNGEYAITSNAGRVDPAVGRDIIIAAPRSTMYVTATGSDLNPGTAAAPFATIQKGVNEVAAGGTVNVAAGLYTERVSIPKALTLLGATAGVSKKNYVAPTGYAYDPNVESIIKPATDALVPVIDVEKVGGGDIAGQITIKGFVLTDQGAMNNDALRGLINLNIYTGLPDGILIENNVIGPHTGPAQNGLKGRGGISSEGPSNRSRKNMVIKDNLIFDNLGDGVGVMLVGAYLSQGSTQDYSGARIENNTISGNTRSGIEIAGGVNGLEADPFVIANNNIKDSGWRIGYGLADYATKLKYGNGINFIRGGGETDSQNSRTPPVALDPLYPFSSPTYVSITGNEITHNEKNGIYMGPMPQHITVAGNTIQSNGTGGGSYQTWDGIRIDLEENYYGVPGSRLYTLPLVLNKFTNNVFNNNTITGNGNMGMRVVQTPTAPVNATTNWWGSACGPGPVGPGSGDKVSANVVYSPWWTAPGGPGTASEGAGGTLLIPAGASTATQNAIIGCAAGKTLTYAGSPTAGGVVVNTNGVTIDLNGATVGPGSPAYTIVGDNVTLMNGILNGNGIDPGVLVTSGADNFILQNMEIKNWGDGVEVAGAHDSLKLLKNWIHNNTDAGIQFDADLALTGVVTINGNLFKANGGDGIKNLSAVNVPAAYNSWGDIDGPAVVTGGDGVSGPVTDTPFTFAELFVDVNPDALAVTRDVNELDVFNVAVKVDAAGLYAAQYKLTYDTNYLTLQDADSVEPGVQITDGSFKAGGSCTVDTTTAGVVSVYCTRMFPDADANGSGQTVSVLTFKADGAARTLNGPWTTYLDLSVVPADLSAGARDGVKVFVNNGGFGADSGLPGHAITDTPDDGKIVIHGLANFTGYIDLQGRSNDSGALLQVFNLASTTSGVEYANGTSASSGKYTTAYASGHQLVIEQTYWFQVDRALYLPTTRTAPPPPPTLTDWADFKKLETRPLTTLTTLVLLGGDANDNNEIDVLDAGCIGGRYGKAPQSCGSGGNSDVNEDGVMDILDLTLMAGNYGAKDSPWTP